jgi:uncharacterized membrane protein
MVPRGDVRALSMSVDEALKYVISMGVVAPSEVAFVAPPAVVPLLAPKPAAAAASLPERNPVD